MKKKHLLLASQEELIELYEMAEKEREMLKKMVKNLREQLKIAKKIISKYEQKGQKG